MDEPTSSQKSCRVIVYFARHGATVWLAHLDNMRLFERALNRAKWPVAWTEDAFNPRPMLVFGLPVGVGIETRRDPVEVTLERQIDMIMAVQSLNDSLPQGVQIVHWEKAPDTKKSLMALVNAADYRIEAPHIGQAYIKAFSHRDAVVVSWTKKGKTKEIDLLPRILETHKVETHSILFKGGAGSSNHLRIDLFLEALVRDGGLDREDALGSRIIRERVYGDLLP